MKSPSFTTATLFVLLAIIAIYSVVQADPPSDEKKFLAVTGGERLTPNMENPVLSDLPKDLLTELGNYDFGKREGGAPPKVHGFAVDLNHDGQKEYFIADPSQMGSGGVGYLAFSEISKRWSVIGDFQGAIYMFPVKKGWPRLVTIFRGGFETWSKTYSEFKDGKYKDKMIERYERGTVTKEAVEEE